MDKQILLNGRAILKKDMEVIILGVNFTQYVLGIDYSMEQPVEYNYNLLGQPASFGKANVSATGTLTLIDKGVRELNNLAKSQLYNGVKPDSYFDLGSFSDLDIYVSYTDGAGVTYTDILNGVHFTNYTRGFTGTDSVYGRDLNMTIGQILLQADETA